MAQTGVSIDVLSDWLNADGDHLGDHDPDGDPLTITDVSSSDHGATQIVYAGNGTSDSPYWLDLSGRSFVLYEPNPGFIGEDSFTYTINDGRGGTANATVRVTVNAPPISSVEWVAVNSPLSANLAAGGGQRIFPDKPAADPSDNTDYRMVKFKATLGKAVPGVTVTFKAFDVDDPSANSDNDPDGIVDNETSDADNYSSDWGLSADTAITDANGIAEVWFRVSMQPGDNWRIVATTNPSKLDGLTAKQNDGTNARVVGADGQAVPSGNTAVVVSNVLTVWRRLYYPGKQDAHVVE